MKKKRKRKLRDDIDDKREQMKESDKIRKKNKCVITLIIIK